MKKILLIILFLFSVNLVSSQVQLCGYWDGSWTSWQECDLCSIGANSTKTDVALYLYDDFLFRFIIEDYREPTKKEKREHRKNNEWYKYRGLVQYYICDEMLTPLQGFRKNGQVGFLSADGAGNRPTKLVTSPATIKIAPYKDKPEVFNIWYDEVGVGLSIKKNRGSNLMGVLTVVGSVVGIMLMYIAIEAS